MYGGRAPKGELCNKVCMYVCIDIHKWIGKLPRPKAGWTPGKYKYMGA